MAAISEPETPDVVAAQPPLTFALLVLGELVFGVQTDHLVQAVMRPQAVTTLPRNQGPVVGVFEHRGHLVPMVDLRLWLAPGAPAGPPCPQVAILNAGGRVLGLAIDSVQGLLRVQGLDVHQIHHDDDAEGFFHSVARAENQQAPVSLLDPERLMAMAQVWSRGEAAGSANHHPGSSSQARAPAQTMTESYAVVRTGESLLGLPADAVGEVLAMPSLQSLFGPASQLLGLCRWRGHDVPVIHVLHALGQPEPDAAIAPWVLILQHGGRMIGVPVDALQSVRRFGCQEVQPHLEVGQAETALISGTVMLPEMQQRVLLLDAQALVQHWPESTLSQSSGPSGTALRGSFAGLDETEMAAETGPYVVFTARQAWAAPMALLREIMTYPMSYAPAESSQGALLGYLEWRGQSLPMLDLRVLTQQPRRAPAPESKVLVLAVGDQFAAVVVDDVHELLPGHLCVHTRWSMGGGVPVHMLTVGQGADQKSYRVIDFPALAFLSDLA